MMRLPRRGLIGFALVLISCGTATFVVQQYEGEPRDPASISVLRVNGGTDVVIVALDGEELNYMQTDPDARAHIEMLPGIHEADVGDLSDPLRRVVTVRFRAEAGKVYRLLLDRMGAAPSLRPPRVLVWEVDRNSDRALSVVPPVLPSAAPSVTATPTPTPGPHPPRAPAASAPTAAPSLASPPAASTSSPGTGAVGTAAPERAPSVPSSEPVGTSGPAGL